MTQQNREQYKKNLYCNCKTQGFPMKQMLVPVLSYRLIFCLGRIIQLGRDGPLEITWSTQSSKQSQVAQRDTQSGLKSLQSKNCTASLGNLVLLFEHPHGVNIFPVSNQNFQSSNLLTFFPSVAGKSLAALSLCSSIGKLKRAQRFFSVTSKAGQSQCSQHYTLVCSVFCWACSCMSSLSQTGKSKTGYKILMHSHKC